MAVTITRSTRTSNRATRRAARRSIKKTSVKKVEAREILPLFTYDLLVLCFEMGDEWGYNRRVSEKVKTLPKRAVFPVVWSMPHFHAAMEPVPEHTRCRVVVNAKGDCLMVDIPKIMFDALPRG